MPPLSTRAWRKDHLRYVWAWTLGILAVMSPLILVVAWRCRSQPASPPAGKEEDPRLTFVTPFRNVRPEVRYVGDEACAACHEGHARAYRAHPMGNSLAPVSAGTDRARYGLTSRNTFEKLGSSFLVERSGDRVFHKEIDRAPGGQVRATQGAEIAFVVGSGRHGHSYLINHDGYLFYSPISWYAGKQAWDLSPGPARVHHFGRAVTAGCLFCHCNQADVVADSANHYRPPIFHGHAIGCERCHGPGELHPSGAGPVEGADTTIVNPRHLPPALRDAVCEQCHLQGVARILRRGRQWFDYRPGLPLSRFLSVFVAAGGAKNTDVVGHVEQMHRSLCYRRGSGAMGCVSCHDPHRLPGPAEKVAYYRDRCLKCHAEKGCAQPLSARRKQGEGDNCVACHMPRADSASVGHVVLTDHRILRRPSEAELAPAPGPADAASPVIPFYPGAGEGDEAEGRRDYALALLEAARAGSSERSDVGPGRGWFSEQAMPLLQEAVARKPDDVPAREARAHALWFLGRLEAAQLDFEWVVEQAPEREDALSGAARVAELLGRSEQALECAERVVRVNPWSWLHRYQLAGILAGRRQWRRAAAESQEGLALNPWSGELRSLRVRCLLAAGEREAAEAEFQRMLPMVADPETARRWFAEQDQ